MAGREKKPLISVVVPVYNVEKYLPKCLDSLLAQTWQNFELILVDDGSPDNSWDIMQDYAARDSRVAEAGEALTLASVLRGLPFHGAGRLRRRVLIAWVTVLCIARVPPTSCGGPPAQLRGGRRTLFPRSTPAGISIVR